MKCSNCKKEIPDDSKFCRLCGKPTVESEPKTVLNSTSQGKRFANLLIDSVVIIILAYPFGYIVGTVLAYIGIFETFNMENWSDEALGSIVYYPLYFLYYLLFEQIWGKTIAKFITKTKVVASNGDEPDFSTLFKRTLIRFIPFDSLSFLKKNPIGWHDKWSKTLVVDDKKTQTAKQTDFADIKHEIVVNGEFKS